MRVCRASFTVCTDDHLEMVDVTKRITDVVHDVSLRRGVVLVTTQAAMCTLLVNEFQSSLVDDLKNLVRRLVPDAGPGSRSADGDALGRLRSALFTQSVTVAVTDGELVLGRFQSIILAELSGPEQREVMVHVIGE